ncbi:hypothetical protein [Streptomyces sp. NPDC057966]|uniref:hypothetical protein n=1 Tax=Streptomyces sp. NPDC057966 TaxID=3346292 RepID=UPI0036ED5851
MADVWVLTNPIDMSDQQLIRTDVITGVLHDKEGVFARCAGQEKPVPLVERSTSFDKRDPLPPGFHLAFVQALNQARQVARKDIQVVRATWSIGQQRWEWLAEDIDLLDQF